MSTPLGAWPIYFARKTLTAFSSGLVQSMIRTRGRPKLRAEIDHAQYQQRRNVLGQFSIKNNIVAARTDTISPQPS